MKLALIENNQVVNIVIGSQDWLDEQSGEWVDITDIDGVGIGWVYDGQDFGEPVPDVDIKTRLSVRQFRELFTNAEKQAIYTAAKSNVDIEIFLDDLRSVEYVDLNFPQTISSVQALEDAGLIAAGRVDEILLGG